MKFKNFVALSLIFLTAATAACSRTETIELPKPGKAPAEAQYLEDTITYYQMNDGTNSTVIESQGPINLEGKRVGIHVTTAFKKDGLVYQRTLIQTENGTLIANGHPLKDNKTGKFAGLIGVLVAPDGNQYWMREHTGPWQPLTNDKTSVSSAYVPINKFFCKKSLQWKDIPAGANATDTACVFEPGSLGESGESIRMATVTGKIGTETATAYFIGNKTDKETTGWFKIVKGNKTCELNLSHAANATAFDVPKNLFWTDSGKTTPVPAAERNAFIDLMIKAATAAKSAPPLQARLAAYAAATGISVPMANNATAPTNNATGTIPQNAANATGNQTGMHFGIPDGKGGLMILTKEQKNAGMQYDPSTPNGSNTTGMTRYKVSTFNNSTLDKQ